MAKAKHKVTIERTVTIERDGEQAVFIKDGDGVRVEGDDITLSAEDWQTIAEELDLPPRPVPPIQPCPWPHYWWHQPTVTWTAGSSWSLDSGSSTTSYEFVDSDTADSVTVR